MSRPSLFSAACYCGTGLACITCARWRRLFRAIQARRRQFAAIGRRPA